MNRRLSTATLGSEDKKRLTRILPGDTVDVGAGGGPDSIRREFEQRAHRDISQSLLFPAAASVTGTIAGTIGMMLWMAGAGVWIAPLAVLANVLIETVGHGIAQGKFSALNACNAKLTDYYNALLEEGHAQACRNMARQVDERIFMGEALEPQDLGALLTIAPDHPAWSEASIGLQITILQARQVVAVMRGGLISPVTFEDMGMNPHNPVHREIVLERLLETQAALAEDQARIPYMAAPVEVFEKNADDKIRLFEMAQTVLWGALRGARSAYFVDPPAPADLPKKMFVPPPATVMDWEDCMAAYEHRVGPLPELPALRR